MGNRRPSPEHQEAVSRRLAQLSAELDGVEAGGWTTRPCHGDPRRPTSSRCRSPTPGSSRATARAAPEPVPDPHRIRRPRRWSPRRAPRVATAGPEHGRRPAADAARAGSPWGRPSSRSWPVLVAVGLAVTSWWVVRGDPQEVAAPALSSPAGGLATPAAPVASASSSAEAGRDRRHGHRRRRRARYAVPASRCSTPAPGWSTRSRRPAGPGRGVDLTALNLARLLVDGEQIVVGVAAPPGVAGARGADRPGRHRPARSSTSTPPTRRCSRPCPTSGR